MEKAPTVPRASALVNATTTTPIQRTFGSTWRERVGIVRGFCIETRIVGDRSKAIIADVANLGSVAVENMHRLKAGGHTHYFLLLPNERVTCVDVYATAEKQGTTAEKQRTTWAKTVTKAKPCRINALRFRTNERVSEWFGSCNGTATQLTPPEGHCIQALYGSVNTERYCGQVGVCYAPVSDSSSSGCDGEADDYKLTEIVRGRMTFQLSFRVHCEQPRAFVVTGESFIKDVAVVDEDQYQAFNELDPSHEYVADHWFVLAKDEHVEAVGVVVEDVRLVALRFRTNYRTSVWFGSPASENVVWLDCAGSPGAFICGFFMEDMGATACTEVTGIAAIYKSQGADEKGEKASKAA